MAKPSRGLPESFSLNLPSEMPAQIGDFFEEEQTRSAELVKRLKQSPPERADASVEITKPLTARVEVEPTPQPLQAPQKRPLRKQLNLSPSAERMLDEIVEYVRRYSAQTDARVSEVFQAIVMLIHNAKDQLNLSALPRRGAWGSVTARNFPSALAEAFERAIVRRHE